MYVAKLGASLLSLYTLVVLFGCTQPPEPPRGPSLPMPPTASKPQESSGRSEERSGRATATESLASIAGGAVEPRADLSMIMCSEDPHASRLVRTPVLVSPDGRHRAYAEVRARVVKPAGDSPIAWVSCANTSRLLLSTPEGSGFRLVYQEEPKRWQLGNGIKLLDWSPDGRYLLLELWIWQYESDNINNDVAVYDTEMSIFVFPYYWRSFRRQHGKECRVAINTVGFSSDSRVVIEASPWDTLEEENCVEKAGLWLLDPFRETLEALPDDYKVQRYGKFEEHKPQE